MSASSAYRGELKERIVTFGNVVRGMRLGYAWEPILQAMIRIEPEGDYFSITMCPPDLIPTKTSKIPHFCWWESPRVCLGFYRAIVERANPLGVLRFSIDDNGEELKAAQ